MTDQDKLNTLEAISNAAWLTLNGVTPKINFRNGWLPIEDQERAMGCLGIIKSTFAIKRGLERGLERGLDVVE
jgi:hypothetical protein